MKLQVTVDLERDALEKLTRRAEGKQMTMNQLVTWVLERYLKVGRPPGTAVPFGVVAGPTPRLGPEYLGELFDLIEEEFGMDVAFQTGPLAEAMTMEQAAGWEVTSGSLREQKVSRHKVGHMFRRLKGTRDERGRCLSVAARPDGSAQRAHTGAAMYVLHQLEE